MSDGTVKISTSLDTSGVEKDLKKVESTIQNSGKKIQSTMDNVEKSMKKASSSFDGSKVAKQLQNVSSSIEKTNSSIDKQKEKLSKLQQAYEKTGSTKQKDNISKQMETATTNITKLETKLKGLKDKEINLKVKMDNINDLDGNFRSASVKAVNELDKIEKKADETAKRVNNIKLDSINQIGESIGKTGQTISGIGDKLTMGVTMPIIGIGTAAAKTGMDFESQMSRVKAISGATGEEIKKLHDQALQLGQDTAFSSKQAAEGFENLASAGFTVNEITQAMPGLLDLAASSGESLANSSDIAASTLRGFGLEASQAGHVADVLAKNAGATNAAVADTGEAMKYIAPVAHAMGLSLEEVTAAIGEMSNAGIKGSQSGTTLRSALTRLASPSDEAATAMEKIGFNAFDSQGKLKKLSVIMDEYNKALEGKTDQQKQDYTATIFGMEAMSGMLVLAGQGGKALDDLTNSYKASDGAAKEMAKTMQDNSKSAIEQMGGSIETAAIKLEEVAAPSIIAISNEIQELANEFSKLSPEVQKNVIEYALLAATAGPVVKTVGTLTGGIGKLVTFGGRLASTLGLLGEGASLGGTALTAFSTAGVVAAGTASALVIGIAGAVTYNNLLSESVNTSTDDLNMWEKAVNACTGGVIKSKAELQKAGLVYKDFGEDVSDSFKEGIEKATKQYHDFEMTLVGANSDSKITDEGKVKIISAINAMIDGAKNSISKRKGEVQSELSKMFTQEGGIDSGEQTVLDEANKASDEKLKKIEEIQTQITGVWEKAIQEHGKLSDADIAKIKDYLKQVQQIRAEVEAKTTAESDYAKNQYSERLTGISADDAMKEYQSASEELKKKFADARATYKTGIEELQSMVKKYNDEGNTEAAANAQKQIDAKKEEYNKLIKTEQEKLKEYRDILYKKNSALEGTMNEVDGSIFSKKDLTQKSNLEAIEKQYESIGNATETGMKRVQDSLGKWHDIYVDVDQSTGKIISTYDTFDGSYAGYSEKFASNAESTYKKVKESMDKLKDNMLMGMKGLKLNDGNQVIKINADGTEETITKLDKVITKIDGTKVAIANVNGEQVKIEFNSDGTIKNMEDLLSVIKDHAKSSPAKVDVDVNSEEAMKRFEEVENEALIIDKTKSKVEIEAEISEAKSRLREVQNALDRLKSKNIDVNINYNKSESDILDQEKRYTRAVQKEIGQNYTGTSGEEGLTTLHEHGWEMSTGENELYYLGSGTGILDHQSSVSAMKNEVSDQVNNSVGRIVSKLVATLGGQNSLLSQVVKNTLETANTSKEVVKINQKLATDLISNISKSTTGTFSDLQNELTTANIAKENASKMKSEENYWVSYYKQWIDSVETDIDGIRDKMDETTDESYKKQLQAQQKILEKQKDSLQEEYQKSKDAAEKEIQLAKDKADQQVKIAEEKKDKLVKLSEAVTAALKTELEGQKDAAEKVINDELSAMEKSYNSKITGIEAETKSKSDEIDAQIKALEEESTQTSREDERNVANQNINLLKTKMANTASSADRAALALQIKNAQKDLEAKEDTWNIEDQKAQLEEEKSLLQERAESRKTSLEEQYNQEKSNKEQELKDTEAFYDKLLTEDSINAQARYLLLQGNQNELVTLLNSYNPDWQNAGQSLADSLLTGLNSQKQSIRDAVSEMVGFRNSSSSSGSNNTYYDAASGTYKGYASGTDYNHLEDLYLTNEKGFELNTAGDVAYVSKGAGIKNHMESLKYIDSEIASQVELMKNAILSEQYKLARLATSTISSINNNSVNNYNDAGLTLQVENLNLNTGQDVEQLSNEMNSLRLKKKI